MLTEVLALELAEHAITVNSVAPGEISTPMTGQEDVDPRSQPYRARASVSVVSPASVAGSGPFRPPSVYQWRPSARWTASR